MPAGLADSWRDSKKDGYLRGIYRNDDTKVSCGRAILTGLQDQRELSADPARQALRVWEESTHDEMSVVWEDSTDNLALFLLAILDRRAVRATKTTATTKWKYEYNVQWHNGRKLQQEWWCAHRARSTFGALDVRTALVALEAERQKQIEEERSISKLLKLHVTRRSFADGS